MKDEPPTIKHLTKTIVFIYAFFSSFWILSSDWLLMLLTSDLKLLTQLQTFKGWAFVVLTSWLIYGLTERGLRSLKASYNLLSAVIQGTTDAIFVKNLEGRYLMINTAGAAAFGRSIEDVIGKDDTELINPEIAHKIQQEDNKVLSSGKTQVYEDVLPLGEQERTYLATKYIYRNSEGNPIGLIGIARDITERKQLLEELKREKEDLAAIGTVTAKSFSTLNLEELLDGLLQRVVEVMGADAAFILLKKDNHLYVQASIGIDEEVGSNYTVRIGQCFAGTIAATMQPMYVKDAQSDFRVINCSLKQSGIRTMLGVPLERNGEFFM
jgi:PAS domain S-box-containing protein